MAHAWFLARQKCEIFFEIRIFNPHAPTNKKSSLSSIYKHQKNMKNRAYAQRIVDMEHSSFTPVVLSVSGGLGREATQFYKMLASLLSAKWDQLPSAGYVVVYRFLY